MSASRRPTSNGVTLFGTEAPTDARFTAALDVIEYLLGSLSTVLSMRDAAQRLLPADAGNELGLAMLHGIEEYGSALANRAYHDVVNLRQLSNTERLNSIEAVGGVH